MQKRKGFTLTELAIVIAVIAILIAVLVPTFTSLITSANESADQQAVKSMNTALSADEALNGTPTKIEDAMAALKEAGYNVENYQALDSGNTIYYDATYNRCLLWTGEEVTYPSDMASTYSGVSGRAASWYTLSDAYNTQTVGADGNIADTSTSIATAISNASAGETVILRLASDVEVSSAFSNSTGAYITIDLNEKELDYTAQTTTILSGGSTLYLKNGTVVDSNGIFKTGTTTVDSSSSVYSAESGSSITLENVDVSSVSTVLYPAGDAAQINVINSTITTTGAYGIGTNASTAYSCTILVENSTVWAKEWATTILVNVDVALTINNSNIISGNYGESSNTHGGLGGQAILCRAGSVTISDSTITQYTNFTNTQVPNSYVSWTAGNAAPFTAIVLGDARENAYTSANATLTMTNSTVNVLNTANGKELEGGRAIYMYGKNEDGYKSSLTFDGSTTINGYVVVGGSQDVTKSTYPAQYECEVVYINGAEYKPNTESEKTYGLLYSVSGTKLTYVNTVSAANSALAGN